MMPLRSPLRRLLALQVPLLPLEVPLALLVLLWCPLLALAGLILARLLRCRRYLLFHQ